MNVAGHLDKDLNSFRSRKETEEGKLPESKEHGSEDKRGTGNEIETTKGDSI